MMHTFRTRTPSRLAGLSFALLGLVLSAVLGSACGSARRAPDGITPPDTSTSIFDSVLPIILLVDSRHQRDLTLFVELPDRRHQRMGRVGPGSTTRWQVKNFARMAAGGGLRFWIEPVGSRAGFTSGVYSDRLRLIPGDTAKWVLESDLRRSLITVNR